MGKKKGTKNAVVDKQEEKKEACNNHNHNHNHGHEHEHEEPSKQTAKQQQMNKILQAINTMDLDNNDFIDAKSFDQGKQILLNMIEDLSFYIKLFENGEYSKFPAPVENKQAEKVATK